MAGCQTGSGSRTRQSDEMFCGDIRNEQRSANRKPSDIAAGEEIIFTGAFFAGKIKTNSENHDEVDTNDGEVNWSERSVGYRLRLQHRSQARQARENHSGAPRYSNRQSIPMRRISRMQRRLPPAHRRSVAQKYRAECIPHE